MSVPADCSTPTGRRPHVRSPRWAAAGAAICAGLLLQMPPVRTAPVPIIDSVETSLAGQALAPPLESTKRQRAVRVNLYPLPTPGTPARGREDDIELALFPDVTVHAVFDRFDTVGDSGTWVGHVAEVPMSSVTLAYGNGLLTANINTRDGVYMIQPAPRADGAADDDRPLHIVTEVDPFSLPQGQDYIEVPHAPGDSQALASPQMSDGETVVDLMVVYTPEAMAEAGGPAGVANSIALQVSDTNAALANSHIPVRLRLVHTELVPYTRTNRGAVDIGNLRLGVGGLARVPALRDTHGADLVSMLVPQAGYDVCGIAYLGAYGSAGSALGYSVIAGGGCASVYVLAHELGHNFGARHDWFVDDAQTPFAFAKGYVDLSQRWRTIMSYDDACRAHGFSCQRLDYFSNPDIEYVPFCSGTTFDCNLLRHWFYPRATIGVAGGPTNCRRGVTPAEPCAADNRRTLSMTASSVANNRQSR